MKTKVGIIGGGPGLESRTIFLVDDNADAQIPRSG
jgi:hypothetical protein